MIVIIKEIFLGSGSSAGGIVGCNGGGQEINITINKCYNTGIIYGVTSGGIITWASYAQIQDCYNTGEIYSNSTLNTGGIAGWIGQNSSITNSYNVGRVSRENSNEVAIGGLLGNYYNTPILTNCYSLNTSYTYAIGGTSGWATLGNDWEGHIEVKTDEDMKKLASKLGDNWAEDIGNINNGYPILKWQIEE